ncbi:hypothetical protein HPP92_016097 [Vanilla planifolia]|uniref:Uncharacterized protein n=1 Tax=Vanilla planifolia TaxID=51239 RepID=A0A835QPY9_VANPL|nr:hypothetical protein HPP92_016097 [Vanilla planifolia]
MRINSISFQSLARSYHATAGLLFAHGKSSRHSTRDIASSPPPSLYQKIKEIVSADDPFAADGLAAATSIPATAQPSPSPTISIHFPTSKEASSRCAPDVCLNASIGNHRPELANIEEISSVVHNVTEIIRANSTVIPMEEHLEEMGVSFLLR